MTVAVCILWNVPYLKELLFPFKLITVALHEFGHASVGLCTGAKIVSIEVNPNQGGATVMKGGNQYFTLPAGYLGSAFWGSLMIFAGFNILASKIVAGIIGGAMLLTLFWAKNWLTRFITVAFIGVIAFLWWFQNSIGLRYFVLFIGTMSALYSLWDIIEDLVLRKVNESDATKFSKLCCGSDKFAKLWGAIWLFISFVFVGIGILSALIAFKDSSATSL